MLNKNKILSAIWTLFPPESKVEIYLRTKYHQFTSEPFFVNFLIWRSKKSYEKWLKNQSKKLTTNEQQFKDKPKITFCILINQTNIDNGLLSIQSIQVQSEENWEILLFSTNLVFQTTILQKISRDEIRIKCIVSKETNLPLFINTSSGKFILFCEPGDTFEKNLICKVYEEINNNPSIQIVYSDIDERNETNTSPIPFFKPSVYSPELHLSTNFLSRAIICKKRALQFAKTINTGLNLHAQEWELLFLLCENNAICTHLPTVLVHQVSIGGESQLNEKEVITSHLRRSGINTRISVERKPEITIRWEYKQPSISIIIPTKDNLSFLKKLIDSIFNITDYKNFNVILVDNNSTDEDVIKYYSKISKSLPVEIVKYNELFNYSKAINLGVSASNAETYLFLNNDMEIMHPDWLTELCQWTTLPGIGVVGAKLLHDDNTIQHAGIILGLQGRIGHLYLNTPDHFRGLTGSVDWYHNYYAVTGACQMVRRDVFRELGGYDEKYQLVFSDIEFCLKAIGNGYRVLYTPNARIKHFEGKTRGYKNPTNDILLGDELLDEWMKKDDPYFSPNLTYTTIPFCNNGKDETSRRINQMYERKKYVK